jgi:hypothetical protein
MHRHLRARLAPAAARGQRVGGGLGRPHGDAVPPAHVADVRLDRERDRVAPADLPLEVGRLALPDLVGPGVEVLDRHVLGGLGRLDPRVGGLGAHRTQRAPAVVGVLDLHRFAADQDRSGDLGRAVLVGRLGLDLAVAPVPLLLRRRRLEVAGSDQHQVHDDTDRSAVTVSLRQLDIDPKVRRAEVAAHPHGRRVELEGPPVALVHVGAPVVRVPVQRDVALARLPPEAVVVGRVDGAEPDALVAAPVVVADLPVDLDLVEAGGHRRQLDGAFRERLLNRGSRAAGQHDQPQDDRDEPRCPFHDPTSYG